MVEPPHRDVRDVEPKISRARGTVISGGTTSRPMIIEDLATAEPGDVQRIAASQIELLTSYYDAVLGQARRSFTWALVAAGVGLVFFLGTVAFLLITQSTSVAVPVAALGAIGGALVEVIAGINFWLYSKTTAQLAAYHQHLDMTQRYLLANSICEALEDETKQTVRASLVQVIANPNLRP
jgi:hypothetical protein